SNDERTQYDDDDKAADLNKTDDDEEDEFVHKPDDYVPTHDENVDDEEFERFNKKMYSDVASAQVKDVARTTGTAASATQKTKVPLQSSSISSDYATKFLNFDNIPSIETKIISMMEIKVQHKDPSIQSSLLLTVHVLVKPEFSTAPATTIPLPITPLISLQQQSTPIPTPITTTTEATTSTTVVPDSSTLINIHQRLYDVENEVKTLRNVDHNSAIRAAVKFEVLIIVKEYLEISMDDALHKALQIHTAELVKEHSVLVNVIDVLQQQLKPHKSAADIRKIKVEQAGKQQEPNYRILSSDVDALWEFDQKRTLFDTMTKTKSFEQNSKNKALYHALMESILEDKDAMDKGIADKLKKRKPDDTDRYEGPPAGPDQWLKRKKTGKETEPLKKAKLTGTSKDTTKSYPKGTGKSAKQRRQYLRLEILKCHRILEKTRINDLTRYILVVPAYKLLKGTFGSFIELEYNMEESYKALMDQLDWNNSEGDRYPFDLSKPLPLIQSRNRQIISVDYFYNNDLACLQGGSTDRTHDFFDQDKGC
nr:hypothetical protein [Tanacetum cinerariifolium]